MDSASLNNKKVLYTPRQVLLASFLGSPLSAAWFLRKNFLASNSPDLASKTTWRAAILTATLLAIGYFLPERFPRSLLPITCSALIYSYAQSIFDRPMEAHLQQGGSKGSWWEVIGVSILVLIFLLAITYAAIHSLNAFGLSTG